MEKPIKNHRQPSLSLVGGRLLAQRSGGLVRGCKFTPPAIVVLSEVRMRLKDKIAIIVGAGQSPGMEAARGG